MKNITPIILILSALGVFFAYIHPRYAAVTGSTDFASKSITELQADKVSYTNALNTTREIEEIHQGLLTKFNGIPKADRDNIAKLLPDHVDTVRLIIDINGIAGGDGMAIKDIAITSTSGESKKSSSSNSTSNVAAAAAGPSPMQMGTAGGATSMPISLGPQSTSFDSVELGITVTGSYENFLKFLHDLESSLRIVDVTSLTFAAVESGAYEFKVSIRTYRLK